MSVGAREDFGDSFNGPGVAWMMSHIILGVLITTGGFVNFIQVFLFGCQPLQNLPGYQTAAIVLGLATLLRGICIFVWIMSESVNPVIEIILTGIPRYFTAASYCLIIFHWCSFCANLLMDDTSGFCSKLRNWCAACISVIGICALSVIVAMSVVRGNAETLYHIEAWTAVTGDLVTFGFIVFFTAKLITIVRSRARLCDCRCAESFICLMSICIASCVIVRASSILISFYGFVYGRSGDPAKRWGVGNLVNTVISLLVCDLPPSPLVFAVFLSGVFSVYEPLP